MKRINLALLLATAILSLNSCYKVTGHGPVVTEIRTASNFTAINSGVPGDLYYTQDSIYKIEIQAQENILKEIETYMSGNELKIKVRDHVSLRTREEIRINISAPFVTELSLSGSGNLKVLQPFRPLHASLVVSGSGTMTINSLESRNIDAYVSGSGQLFVFQGKGRHEDVEISGSENIDLSGVISNTARTHTRGSGSIRLQVEEELNSKISGSGSVYYKGNRW